MQRINMQWDMYTMQYIIIMQCNTAGRRAYVVRARVERRGGRHRRFRVVVFVSLRASGNGACAAFGGVDAPSRVPGAKGR
jgi:hypothetical protein